ncbi:MAG TPA: hypothetical protein VG406_02235 [Isosphaeraceae bacterium]|jgi:hypothetical protein|nr:hypothetical protein [Isosphaeraceae bacterium]
MPPPASNEAQGLKIATIIFVSLSLILAVTTYLGYDSAMQASAKETKAKQEMDTAKKQLGDRTREFREFRGLVWGQEGEKLESPDEMKNALTRNLNRIKDASADIAGDIRKKVNDAQAKGTNRQEIAQLSEGIDQAVKRLAAEQSLTLESRIATLLDLLRLQTHLASEFALDNVDLRTTLEGVNASNDVRVKNAEQARDKAVAEKQAADAKHEADRAELVAKLDKVNSTNAELAQQVTDLKSKLDKMKTDFEKQLVLLRAINRENQEQLRKDETRLEKRDATVTYVDRTRREVHTTLTKGMGARPQLRFSIFDRGAHGLPTDKPKATIELTWVGDSASVGKIVKQVDYADPIRPGDQVYSPTWDPNHPLHFALIGKIDINRDGADDRDALRRLIQISGGVVDYDLPPPREGSESGQISPRIDYYVYDDSKAFRSQQGTKTAAVTDEDRDFLKKQSDVIAQARNDNLRPLPVERLLAWLGYSANQALPGRPEAVNRPVSVEIQGGRQTDASNPTGANTSPDTAKPDDKGQQPGDKKDEEGDEPK